MSAIHPIVMPKWGLAMQEGTLTSWLIAPGAQLEPGVEVAEIETTKITNVLEATVSGTVRRLVAEPGSALPVAALLAVVADPSVPEEAIDQFITSYHAEAAAAAAEAGGPPEPATVDVGGRRVRFLKLGEGERTIVLIHGFGADLVGWLFTQPALAEDHTVYALDLPGHGGSSLDVGAADLAFFAGVVAGFLDAVGVSEAHLVGHSMGGAVALAVAMEHPKRVTALTLIAPVGLGPEVNMAFIDGFVALQRKKDARPLLEQLVGDPRLISRDMIEDVLRYKRMDGVDRSLRSVADRLFPGGRQAAMLRDALGAVAVPVQVIWGAKDRILPAGHAEGLPKNVAVHVLANAGHVPHMEAAGEVNRLIAALG